MTEKMVELLMKGVAPVLRTYVKREIELAVEPLRTRIKELEAFDYRDIWDETTAYSKNHLVTSSGSLWIAREASIGVRPGLNPSVWRLCVKRGRDGKDYQSAGAR